MSDKKLQLFLYKSIPDDELIILRQQAERSPAAVYEFYSVLLKKTEERGLFAYLWCAYLADYLLTVDNFLSRNLSRINKEAINSDLWALALQEIETLRTFFVCPLPVSESGLIEKIVANFSPAVSVQAYGDSYRMALQELMQLLEKTSAVDILNYLADFYYTWGYGEMVRFSFFDWQEGLSGVALSDPISLTQLIGYEGQKETILSNTEAFVSGKPANNILLYGQKGTGKSSLVKAVLNQHAKCGLRLLSLSRYSLCELPEILRQLSGYRQQFIIFLDDLSFDSDEKDYKYIKTYIEGGAAILPENVLLYATSNRRHLVAESWRDRQENGEDIYLGDTVTEKLSLSDRFGITIHFAAPDQEEYLSIVEGIAQNEGLLVEREHLRREALKWERWQNSRSARTARQFINYIQGLQ